MLLNKDKQVWVGSRLDADNYFQMPQGGIDDGEDIVQAMWRELEEEIGLSNTHCTLIEHNKNWLYYDLPQDISQTIWKGKYRGQKQQWFVLQLHAEDTAININTAHPEFKEWKWIDRNKLADAVIPFKKEIYKKVLQSFHHIWAVE